MPETQRLLREARKRGDGEAYAAITKAAGFRLGLGARTVKGDGTSVFVELVLDPFPHRPRVDAGCLAAQSEVIGQLQARGYAVTCEDDGTVTCERIVEPGGAEREIRVVRQLMESHAQGSGPRPRRSRKA